MKNSVISLAKNSFVVVNAEQVEQVLAMANRVGVMVHGGALVERRDGGYDKVLYTEQPAPWWVALVEALDLDQWAEVTKEERKDFFGVCEALGVMVHGGAIVERSGKMLQGFYIE